MTKTTKTPQNEKILSVRRVIEEKKQERGLTSPVLMLKSLKKYRDLASMTYPKSLYNSRYYYMHRDSEGCFAQAAYEKVLTLQKHQHVFDKMVNDVAKMIVSDFESLGLTSEEATPEQLVSYLSSHGLEGYQFRKVVVDESFKTTFKERHTKKHAITDDLFGYALFHDFKLGEISSFWSIERPKRPFANPVYISLTERIKKAGTYSGKNAFKGKKAHMMDFPSFLAKAVLLRLIGDYLVHSEVTREKIETKMKETIKHSEEDIALFRTITPSFLMEVFERNNGTVPDYFRSLTVLTLELMLQEATVLTDYEDRIKKISGTYATSYMTKKNIPQKVQDYMAQNRFLTMFGYVEADEKCDLEMLKGLEQQFVEFSNQLPLIHVADHSLRFRRLGKLKAAGVYFPGANTLAVNLDNMDAFTHEYFHLIDFTQGLLSLEDDFKPLFHRYCELTESLVQQLPSTHKIVTQWEKGSSKYSKSYFQSPEEAFARMGEIYVANCLNIDSSFNQSHFKHLILDATSNGEAVDIDWVVYPQDQGFIEMIQGYFDQLFNRLKETKALVRFDESNPTQPQPTPVVQPTLSQEVKEEVAAMWDAFSGKGVQLSLF